MKFMRIYLIYEVDDGNRKEGVMYYCNDSRLCEVLSMFYEVGGKVVVI